MPKLDHPYQLRTLAVTCAYAAGTDSKAPQWNDVGRHSGNRAPMMPGGITVSPARTDLPYARWRALTRVSRSDHGRVQPIGQSDGDGPTLFSLKTESLGHDQVCSDGLGGDRAA